MKKKASFLTSYKHASYALITVNGIYETRLLLARFLGGFFVCANHAHAVPLKNVHNFKEKVDYTVLDQPASNN